ncbi:MAG TPA: class II aldolase/adducin family protein [Afifellaceae bacterium]|nr:class II aldolase/adducin family protein [Afifellaceae bacterium]
MSRSEAEIPAPDPALLEELVVANRILSHQQVVDAFGHISVRHPKDPGLYLMARHLAPGLVTAQDIVTFDLDSNPLVNMAPRYYSERYIHGEIYKLRPEVHSVVHCHARPLIPFGVAKGARLQPIYHMSAFLGLGVPVFEIRDAAGMTDMLVRDAERGQALAHTIGDKPVVLMRGHGATMVGASIKEAVYRAVYTAENAILQMEAMRLGDVEFLAREEAELATAYMGTTFERAWAYWKRLAT